MTNRLADTLSPYLRAHADNPVDWHPWGQEAFDEARARQVPLLISIGYSTCHWCHVMARESFADEATAAAVNAGFVAVKVDREEHPEVDAAFLAAASAFTQNLGWPLTVFTTPEGRAFYAGTYWPPEARGGLPAFGDVLAAVREAWEQRRDQVVESADAVAGALAHAATTTPTDLPDAAALAHAAETIAATEDHVFGGFGGAPKFPMATTLRYLQAPLVRRESPEAAAAAERTFAAIAGSDLRDADGGIFRYATQRDWSVPHYERMLIDNAQLLDVAVDAGDVDTARGIAAFLTHTLQRPQGGFAAAQDSESIIDGARNEGGYYRRALADRASLEPPTVDGKVLTGWNGLAIGALARAGSTLGEPTWIESAARAARDVLDTNRGPDGELVRSSLDGVAAAAAVTTADLGLLADGLFALAGATGEAVWAVAAREALDRALQESTGDPVLVARGIALSPDRTDGDLPSGRAAVASAALAAWRWGAGERFREVAERAVRDLAAHAQRQPTAYGSLLRVAAGLAEPPRQMVVVTDEPWGALALAARRADADATVVATPSQARAFAEHGFALLEGKDATAERVYDCRAFVCRLPVAEPADVHPSR